MPKTHVCQGRIQEFLMGGGGANFTQYVEAVLQLITSAPLPASIKRHFASHPFLQLL